MVVSPEQMLVGMGLIVASQVKLHLCTSHLANPLFSPLHSLQLSLDRCMFNIRAGFCWTIIEPTMCIWHKTVIITV